MGTRLHLYAPRMSQLTVRGCWSLKEVVLLSSGKKTHTDYNLPLRWQFPFDLNAVETDLPPDVFEYLKSHPRLYRAAWFSNEEGDPVYGRASFYKNPVREALDEVC